MFRACSIFMLVLVAFSSVAAAEDQPLARIAVGSCIRQDKPQPIWSAVLAYQPQLFVLLGDNIYGDTRDMAVLEAKYKKLAANEGFQKLRASCPVLAVWDDHDYGENDAGVEYPQKVASQKIFNDFFQVPADAPRRQRAGLYDAQLFGPEGQRVQLIFLDTRYFRSPLTRLTESEKAARGGVYGPTSDPKSTMLGEEQWAWLAEQLKAPAQLRIIATSVQFVPDEHGWEKWGNFPHERARLIKLIHEQRAEGVVLISGDRHLAEISRLAPESNGPGYPLYDLTASSINQPGGQSNASERNSYRIGENYREVNFGAITIDWQAQPVTVELAVCDLKGETVRAHKFPLSELSFSDEKE